jgi:hypothetical protein
MLLPEYTISTVFNDIRRNRLGHNGIDMQHAGQMKMDEFGYDTVLFVPQDYFVTGNRDGEFFSVDFPETFIPEGILECSEPRNRIEKIAHQIDGDADEQKIADTLFLAKALPAGLSNIAVLVKRNDEPARPNLMKVPTAIFDKAAAYFLQHPTTTQTAMKSYQEMCDIVGEPPTSTSIQIALEAGLLDHDQTTARSLFEDFVRPLGGTGMKAPAAQAAITQAFNTLTRLGNILRGVYSEEDMTCFRQSGTAMLADEM